MQKLIIALAALTLAACADASPANLANPFKAQVLTAPRVNIKAGPPPQPTPPWTTTANPNTNAPVYMGGSVIVEFSTNSQPGSWQIAWISTVTTAGYIGTTPMLETILATNAYTTIGTASCELFDNLADANAAIAYIQTNGHYVGFNGGCIGYVNPNNY